MNLYSNLTDENIELYCIRHYNNPQCISVEDYHNDMRRFKYIKRLLKKYHKGTEVKLNLLLNHIVIIYNVFGDAAPLLLFYKMERDYWSDIKAIMMFLNKYPEMESESLQKIAVNDCILEELKQL